MIAEPPWHQSLNAGNSSIHALSNHFPQLPFLGEFTAKEAKVGDEVFAGLDEGLTGSKRAVGLDAEDEGAGVDG